MKKVLKIVKKGDNFNQGMDTVVNYIIKYGAPILFF